MSAPENKDILFTWFLTQSLDPCQDILWCQTRIGIFEPAYRLRRHLRLSHDCEKWIPRR